MRTSTPRKETQSVCAHRQRGLQARPHHVRKHFLLISRGVLGPRPAAGDIGEISYLGRIVCWTDAREFPNDGGTERIEIEAGPRHAQILLAAANLMSELKPSKTLLNCLLKNTDSIAVRRCVCAISHKTALNCSMQRRSGPVKFPNRQKLIDQALKRACRFILGSGKCIWTFVRQATPTQRHRLGWMLAHAALDELYNALSWKTLDWSILNNAKRRRSLQRRKLIPRVGQDVHTRAASSCSRFWLDIGSASLC